MGMVDELKELGANVDEAMQRFMNNAALYEKMLKKLPKMLDGAQVIAAIDQGKIDSAIETAHTLKGVLGNLSITPLYESYTEIVTLLRKGDPEKAKSILEESIPIEKKVAACIEKYQ